MLTYPILWGSPRSFQQRGVLTSRRRRPCIFSAHYPAELGPRFDFRRSSPGRSPAADCHQTSAESAVTSAPGRGRQSDVSRGPRTTE